MVRSYSVSFWFDSNSLLKETNVCAFATKDGIDCVLECRKDNALSL